MGLGDAVETALHAVGVTPALVERWVGGPCGCPERKARLNALGAWAARVLRVGTADAAVYLRRLLEDE